MLYEVITSRILVYYIVADADLYFDFVLCQDIDGYKYPVTNIGSKTFMASYNFV